MPYIGNITSDFSIDTGNITNRAVTATKLSPSSVGSNGQVLSVDGSGNLQWSADASGTALTGSTNNTITTVTGANAIQGEANLTFDGSTLAVTGNATFSGNIFTSVLRRDVQDSSVILSGGNATNDGANIALYGSTHGSQAGNFEFRSGASYVLKIKSDGKLGIGTTNPDTLLHLAGADTAVIRLENNDTSLNTDQLIGGLEFEKQDPSGAGVGVVGGLRMYSGVNGITTYLTLSTSNDSTNDEEHVRITEAGYVGINTSSPSRLLTVSTDSTTAYSSTAGSNDGILRLHNINGSDNTGVNNQVGIEMYVSTGATSLGMLTFTRTGNNTGDLTYKSRIANGNYAEHFRIQSDGKVGIGTTSPSTNLEVKSGTTATVYINAGTHDASTANEAVLKFGYNQSHATLDSIGYIKLIENGGNAFDGDLAFGVPYNNSGTPTTTEKLRIKWNGNVGIGTIAPTKLLHLSGGSSPTLKISATDATPAIFMGDADRTSQDQHLGEFQALWNGTLAGRIVIVAGPDTTNKDDGHMDFYTSEGGSNGHRMRIKHNGYIGIGTSAPTFLLDIRKNATAVKAHIGASDGSLATMPTSSEYGLSIAGGNVEFGLHKDASDNYQAILGTYQGVTDIPLVFRTGSRVERLRIAKNGTITSTYPTVTVAQDTNQDNTTGHRFEITLPDNSRMFRIQGSFSFAGTHTYRIWGDLGSWSDSHTASIEGFANWWENAAGGPTYQDTISAQYFEVADPVDAQCCEVTYDIVVTTMAFFHGGSENQGGGRPGVSGTIRWTKQNVGNAFTIFSYQDTNAKATDRLLKWTWDIDQVSGTLGAGKHHYVVQALPLTGDAQSLGDAA